ncbi:MAG: MFS transporter [Actinobacteria bacterium]|nr:MFS transporter [Actinomycetota bacterium]
MKGSSGSNGSDGTGVDRRTAIARMREVASSRGFRNLLTARTVSQFGDGVFQVSAASVLLFQHPGANPAAGLFTLTAATLIPFSIIGPFVGVFIDRWNRRKILTVVPLSRAAVAALLPIAALAGTHSAAFYIDTLVVLSANRFFLATASAVLPSLVPQDDLLVANSAMTTAGSVANVLGLGAGSALSAAFSGQTAALISAAAFALAAILSRAIPVHEAEGRALSPVHEDLRAVLRDLGEGARAMGMSARVRYGMAAITLVQLLVGAMAGVLTYFIIHVLRLKVDAATSLLALLAVGIGIGVFLVPFAARRLRHDLLVPIGFAIGAAGTAIGAGLLSKSILTVSAWFMGISYAFCKIPVDTIVQEEMPDIVRGRAFAAYDMIFNIARVAGVGAVAIAFGRGASTRACIAGAAFVFVLGAFAFWSWERGGPMWKRRGSKGAGGLQPGEFVTVRAHSGYRADEEPRAIVSGGKEMQIEEIEWRAVVEEGGKRTRVFVVRVEGARVRLGYDEDGSWMVERLLPSPSDPSVAG